MTLDPNIRHPKPLARNATVLAAILVLAGCKPPLPPPKPLAELTLQETSGYHIYQANCVRCHYANSEKGFHGPGLRGLYKKPYLPSGAPANDERIAVAILQGRGMMPAFGSSLDDRQLADLIAYLHTL
jgi:mono/diheme cytochrome c family protein